MLDLEKCCDYQSLDTAYHLFLISKKNNPVYHLLVNLKTFRNIVILMICIEKDEKVQTIPPLFV